MINQRIGLMFAGQGAQYPGMGRDLAENFSAARQVFAESDRILQRPISALCHSGSAEELTDTANCQPAIYAVSIACLEALRERTGNRLNPAVCAGLSLGEFAALHAAAAISFATGLQLLGQRGKLMAEACRETHGTMAAVLNAERETVEQVCRQCGIDVANYNCPGQLVVSGEKDQVENAIAELGNQGISRVVPLSVAGAFHSRLMRGAARSFAPLLDSAEIMAPSCPVAQNATGQPATKPERIKENLKKQVDGSVLWESCVRDMMARTDLLLEMGPGSALCGFVRRIDRNFPAYPVGTAEQVESVAGMLA